MADTTYIYKGARQDKHGVKKTFSSAELTEEKLKRLDRKGWVKVVAKKKAAPPKKKQTKKSGD